MDSKECGIWNEKGINNNKFQFWPVEKYDMIWKIIGEIVMNRCTDCPTMVETEES